MKERIACGCCGSSLYSPPPGREYGCPVCGRRLPRRSTTGELAAGWAERMARGSLALGCLATIAAAGWHLILTPAARTSARTVASTASARAPYRPAEEQRYRLRIRQLERDLEASPREYGVIVKLAALHTRLALREEDPVRKTADLERARELYLRATEADVSVGRRDYEYALFQLDRLAGRYPLEDGVSEPVPSSDPVGSVPVYSYDVEPMLHMRLYFLRSRVAELPDNARHLCRLGWTYYRLAQAMKHREPSSDVAFFYESAREQPKRMMARAEEALLRTTRVARTREYRVEAYQGLAEIYQIQGRREEAVAVLRKIVALQPNHWPAHGRLAAILSHMGRVKEAEQARILSKSWRTPEWL